MNKTQEGNVAMCDDLQCMIRFVVVKRVGKRTRDQIAF